MLQAHGPRRRRDPRVRVIDNRSFCLWPLRANHSWNYPFGLCSLVSDSVELCTKIAKSNSDPHQYVVHGIFFEKNGQRVETPVVSTPKAKRESDIAKTEERPMAIRSPYLHLRVRPLLTRYIFALFRFRISRRVSTPSGARVFPGIPRRSGNPFKVHLHTQKSVCVCLI